MGDYVISFPNLGLEMNPSRVAFSVFGKDIYWYGVLIAIGFLCGLLYAAKYCPRFKIKNDDLIDCVLLAVPLAVIFGRMYYVVFNFSEYKGDFWSMFKVWEGGIAIYGVIFGAVLAVYLMCRKKRIRALPIGDLAAVPLLFAQVIGRWGNFLNREAFGIIGDGVPAFIRNILEFFTMELTKGDAVLSVQPIFFYESVWNLIGVFILLWVTHHRKFDGHVLCAYMAWYGFARFFLEYLRADSLRLFGSSIRVSGLISALIFLAGAGVIVYNLHIRKTPLRPAQGTVEESVEEVTEEIENTEE